MSPRGSSPRLLRGGGNRSSVSLRAIRGDTRLLIRRSVPVQQARRHRGIVAFGRRAPQSRPAAAARDGPPQRGAGALGGGSEATGARDAKGQPRQPPPQEEAPVPHDGSAPSGRQGPRAAPQSAAAREDRDRSFANQRAIARTNLIGEDTNVAAGRRQGAHGEAETVARGTVRRISRRLRLEAARERTGIAVPPSPATRIGRPRDVVRPPQQSRLHRAGDQLSERGISSEKESITASNHDPSSRTIW